MQAPTLKEIKNASYSGIEGLKGSVKLVDGKWKGRPYKKGSASRPVVSLIGDFRITGDLDGDGTDDAVVLLNYAPGGTGQLLHLALMARKKGKIQNLATALIGDRVQIRDVRIEQKRIFVDVIQAGPKDAMCCPGEVTTREWTLEPGGKLNRYTVTAKPARLTLETIGNTEWILRSWDSKQPAPTRPAVTLIFKDGRFTGSSGCNNYFAPAKDGKIPGDVEVGAAGTTRKSCPANEMSVERRFLEQLVRVRKFGFLVTQLALSWEKDGVWKTMLFDKRQPRPTDK
ncbi:MAG TPA: META domain-containing protein [Candidatus Binatia bacterium]|nr:META domain-containing protein [Candidatus Binatia bacterium]